MAAEAAAQSSSGPEPPQGVPIGTEAGGDGRRHPVRDAVLERMEVRRKPTVVGIQYLRALAALGVVYFHCFSTNPTAGWQRFNHLGEYGVDVFFVISGFIMWSTTASHPAGRGWTFLRRRAERIYPVWWIVLTAWILLRFAHPDSLHNRDVDPGSLIASYTLYPRFHPVFAGQVMPILPAGWTLQLEIVFYLLFALCLLVPAGPRRLVSVCAALLALVAAGILFRPDAAPLRELTSTLLCEFLLGIAVAVLAARLRRLGVAGNLALIAIAAAWVWRATDAGTASLPSRALWVGVPAALLVAGTVGLEDRLRRRPWTPVLLIGDASYSLYLIHTPVVMAVAFAWERLRLPMAPHRPALLLVPVAMAASVAVAIVFYRLVELPVLDRFAARRARRALPARPDLAALEGGPA